MCINIHIFLYACITFQILSSSLTKYIFFCITFNPEISRKETLWNILIGGWATSPPKRILYINVTWRCIYIIIHTVQVRITIYLNLCIYIYIMSNVYTCLYKYKCDSTKISANGILNHPKEGRWKNPWTASTKPLWSMRAPSCCKPAVCGHNQPEKWSPSHSHYTVGTPQESLLQLIYKRHDAAVYPYSCRHSHYSLSGQGLSHLMFYILSFLVLLQHYVPFRVKFHPQPAFRPSGFHLRCSSPYILTPQTSIDSELGKHG